MDNLDKMHDRVEEMRGLELDPSELPYNTEVIYNGAEIHFIKETEKAFLLCYTTLVRRGTSKISDHVEHTVWCPKSVWANNNNFEDEKLGSEETGRVFFKMPYFMNK